MAEDLDLTVLTTEIITAYVASNRASADELPALIRGVHGALKGLSEQTASQEEAVEKPTTAQIRRSITPDKLISFIDGRPYASLKRHLTRHGLDLHGYRERYGLPADYPSVAPAYAARRSELAKAIGLGSRGKSSPAEEPAPAPKRGRSKAAAKA